MSAADLSDTSPEVVLYMNDMSTMDHNSDLDFIKCVVLGDEKVGKTSLIRQFAHKQFYDEHMPTASNKYEREVRGRFIDTELYLYDTVGQEDWNKLDISFYSGTDIFIICCAFDSKLSFDNAKEQWLRKVRESHPRAVCLLVANKNDLNVNKQFSNVVKFTYDDLDTFTSETGVPHTVATAKQYISAESVFERAVTIGIRHKRELEAKPQPEPKPKSTKCCFL